MAAGRLEGAGAGGGLERGFGSEAGHSVGESHRAHRSETDLRRRAARARLDTGPGAPSPRIRAWSASTRSMRRTHASPRSASCSCSLRDQRDELVRLRDRLIELRVRRPPTQRPTAEPTPTDLMRDGLERRRRARTSDRIAGAAASRPDEEARLIRLRMQGVVDQMQASVARIDALGHHACATSTPA